MFQILTAAGGVSGQFDMNSTVLPNLAAGQDWLVQYGATSVTLRVVVELPGDYNRNGVVGPEDYGVWAANFGSTANLSADGNNDGIVSAPDYAVWRDHLGQVGSGLSLDAPVVPEPTALALAGICAVVLCGFARCTRERPRTLS
jgi:hypothetical protein